MMTTLDSEKRWKKRLFALVVAASLVVGLIWATTPKARLAKPVDRISAKVQTDILDTARLVDEAIEQEIEGRGLEMAGAAHWLAVARRISLALVGNGLSLEDIRVLEQVPESDRIQWWTEYLLQDRRSADYQAERWTRALVGTNQGPFLIFRRRKFVDWMADSIEKNTPYHQIVQQLLTARGSWTDAPQVNFITATMDTADDRKPDAIRLAGRTSRAFLAQRIDCLQCHEDYIQKVPFPTIESKAIDGSLALESESDVHTLTGSRYGEQADFHQLAAFFSGVRMQNPVVGLRETDSDYEVTYLNETEPSSVSPTVPFYRDLVGEQGSERERLAAWITHPENRAFARATVNRVWANLFGKPLVEPIDNIPLDNSVPRALDILSEHFVKSGYDLRSLTKAVASTRAFSRDSRLGANHDASNEITTEVTDQHEQAWAVFPLTQLRPEQVAASIHQAARIKTIDQQSSIVSQLELFGGVNDFIKAYGDRGEDEFDSQAVTIPQRLLVMNGSYVGERINHNPVMNAVTRIADACSDDSKVVEVSYLSVLNRFPAAAEKQAFMARMFELKGRERSDAVGGIFWTLFNSTEFQWNH
jgi:hypothetical protein